MTVPVINAQHPIRESGKLTFVVMNGVAWGIFSVGVSKVAVVAKARRLQQDSPSLRVRVT